jgi:hypothetical protein
MVNRKSTPAPPLPAAALRKLRIHLEKLKEELGLDEAHLPRPDSPDRRKEAAQSRIAPTEDGPDFYDRFTGVRLSSDREVHDFIEQHQNDPETIDMIGREPAIEFVVRAYDEIARLHLEMWIETPATYEEFRKWLKPLKTWATRKGKALWPGRRTLPSDEKDWYERMPGPHANARIDSAADGWWQKARDYEEEHPAKSLAPALTPGVFSGALPQEPDEESLAPAHTARTAEDTAHAELPAPVRKAGRKPDFERAARIVAAIARVSPEKKLQARVDDILEALDAEPDPLLPPLFWRRDHKWKKWADCDEHRVAIKIFEYAQKILKRLGN